MRTTSTRLAGLVAGLSLVVAPLVVASPAHAADLGSVTITIKDDLNVPVKAGVTLIPLDDAASTYSMPATPDAIASTYTVADVPVGDYAIMVTGGWGLITCVGITPCGLGALAGGATEPVITKAITVSTATPASYTVETPTPELVGTARVGETLEVPNTIDLGMDLGDLIDGFIGPKVVWKRDGVKIQGAKTNEYTLTRRDVGTKVSATISFPPLLALLFSSLGGGVDITPAPITKTTATVGKNASKTKVKVSGGTALVTVTGPADEVTGWVKITIKGQQPIWARVQDGFAPVELPSLKAGKVKIVVAYQGNGELNGSTAKATVKVKKAKKSKK